MIYTVTLNPSLDYIVSVPDLELGMTNRTKQEIMFPGGKGINVSIVLKNLGMTSTLLGFVSGFTGEEIRSRVRQMELNESFIKLHTKAGISRINVKIRAQQETEVNGNGPDITSSDIEKLYAQLDNLQADDVLVLSGNIPSSISSTIYQDIMAKYQKRGILIAVDATKELLTNVLPLHPFVIKPNHHELAEIFGVKLSGLDDIIHYAKELQRRGARNVIVSMGKDGAVVVTQEHKVYQCGNLPGNVKNTVGAGDSMVAGFVYGYRKYQNYKMAFIYGVSCGSASACSENLAVEKEVEKYRRMIEDKNLVHTLEA